MNIVFIQKNHLESKEIMKILKETVGEHVVVEANHTEIADILDEFAKKHRMRINYQHDEGHKVFGSDMFMNSCSIKYKNNSFQLLSFKSNNTLSKDLFDSSFKYDETSIGIYDVFGKFAHPDGKPIDEFKTKDLLKDTYILTKEYKKRLTLYEISANSVFIRRYNTGLCFTVIMICILMIFFGLSI